MGTALAVVFLELYLGWAHKEWFTRASDFDIYRQAARDWLSGGSYFLPRQLDGPYVLLDGDRLYPPVALWLFVPFTVLPVALWFAIPFGVIAAALRKLRPAPWALAVIAILLIEPGPLVMTVSGNPLIWCVAIEFAAVVWRFPASFALIKTSLLPLALWGVWRRSWWIGLGLLVALSLPVLPLTMTWIRVVLDMRGGNGIFYSIGDYAYMAIPLVALAGSAVRAGAGPKQAGMAATSHPAGPEGQGLGSAAVSSPGSNAGQSSIDD